MSYNGHKNWAHWNVALWIGNDEGLYRMAVGLKRCYSRCGGSKAAAVAFVETMQGNGVTQTPDGAKYSVTAVTAAIRGLEA